MKLGRRVRITEPMRVVHVSLSASDADHFQRIYPDCMTRFVRNAVKIALSDKNFFDKIFFLAVE